MLFASVKHSNGNAIWIKYCYDCISPRFSHLFLFIRPFGSDFSNINHRYTHETFYSPLGPLMSSCEEHYSKFRYQWSNSSLTKINFVQILCVLEKNQSPLITPIKLSPCNFIINLLESNYSLHRTIWMAFIELKIQPWKPIIPSINQAISFENWMFAIMGKMWWIHSPVCMTD